MHPPAEPAQTSCTMFGCQHCAMLRGTSRTDELRLSVLYTQTASQGPDMAGSTANLLYVKGLAKHCGLPGVGCPGYQQLLLGSLKSLQARRCCLKGMSRFERCRWGQEPGHAILKACPNKAQNKLGSQLK